MKITPPATPLQLLEILLTFELFLTLVPFYLVAGQQVSLYEHYKRKGRSFQLKVGKSCTALPPKWQDKASSIDTHGTCITFYEQPDCTGRYMRLRPGTATYVSNLKKIKFNDVISSAKPCKAKVTLVSGRYAIQNMEDEKYLTARPHFRRGFTHVETEPWRRRISQQWDIEKNWDGTYWLIPRVHSTKNPLTYNLKRWPKVPFAEPGMFADRMYWNIDWIKGETFLIRNEETRQCVAMDEEVEEQKCNPKLEGQQWTFHRLA